MGGSILKNLKSDLQQHELLRHQKKGRKGKTSGVANGAEKQQLRRERDAESLSAIRQAFNPFEKHFDRNAAAGGSKATGRPVAARTAAEKQRRQTWEAEKRLQNKVGGVVDRRFGEKNSQMSEQEKMVERFAREKLNNIRKASKKSFNIEDDNGDNYDPFGGADSNTLLTHGGKALEFDDFQEGDLGFEEKQDQQEYERAHEGREGRGHDTENGKSKPERPKTKAEIMQEVIAKSKMHKFERQQQQQQDENAIDALNADFDDLMAELAGVEESAPKTKREVDAYDTNVQEFAWDKRADPGDRTKTAEELTTEAEEKRRAAERAKLARMEGDELDIDLDYEDVRDDAQMFGLDDDEASGDEAASGEGDVDGSDSDDSDGEGKGMSGVKIPQSAEELRRLDHSVDKLRYYVKAATPGRGSGNQAQLHAFGAALADFAVRTPARFGDAATVLHELAPVADTGVFLANHMRELVQRSKRRSAWTRRDLLLFALVGSLFSTSDQWHVVATSASLVMTQRLNAAVAVGDVPNMLFLCDLLLVYQRTSKRYIPEVPAYLLRALAMLVPKTGRVAERYVRLSPKRWVYKPAATVDNGEDAAVGSNNASIHCVCTPLTPEQALTVICRTAVKAASLWRSLDAFPEVFRPLLASLQMLKKGLDSVKDVAPSTAELTKLATHTISHLERLLHFGSAERRYLELQNFRPIGIKTQAPAFDENYNPEVRGQGMDPEKRELQKLKALHKKERKSTMREIRRDAEFESRQRLSDKRAEMDAYHSKLKRLEGQINGEEGAERNAYERERKRRRK